MTGTLPITQCLVRRCYGKSLSNKLLIEAYKAAGWQVREIYKGVTVLSPPAPPSPNKGEAPR